MKNTKTFVTVLAAALLAAVMVFTSCSQPTDGDPGSPGGSGNTGGVVLNGEVTAAELAAVFAVSPTAILGSTAATVYGEIPAGKTLIVAGDAAVKTSQTLDVEGTLEIRPSASLDASGLSGVGTLVFSGGPVVSNGTVKIDAAQYAKLADITGGGIKAVGAADFSSLSSAASLVPAVYIDETVTIDASAVTAIGTYLGVAGNTLYLGGTVTGAALSLADKSGELVIDGTYTAGSGANLTASSAGNIIVKGTLSVGAVTLAGKFDLQDGTLAVTGASPTTTGASFTGNKIKALTTSAAAAVTLTGVTEIGTLSVSNAGPTLTATALTTIGKIAAGAATTLPASVTTIDEVSGDSAVTLGTDGVLTIASGKTLEIKGTASIVSTTGSGTTLDAGTYTAAGGDVTLAKAGALTIAGTLTGKPVITTFSTATGYVFSAANLAKLTGLTTGAAITYSDSTLTGSTEAITIPENLSVTVSTGTLAEITGLTIGKNAKLLAAEGTFAKVAHATLGEGATLTAKNTATFPELLTLVFGKGASATATGATFPKATSITLGEDVEVSMDEDGATLGELLTLTLGEGAELEAENATLAKLTTLSIAEDAKLIVGDDVTFAAITTVSGAGKLELGEWDFSPKAEKILQIPEVESAATALSEAFTVPANKVLTLKGAAVGTADKAITVNGTLVVGDSLKLMDNLTVENNTGLTALALAKEASIILGSTDKAKITGGTYEITATKANATLTADDTDDSAVAFTYETISGYIEGEDEYGPIADLENVDALVLAFGDGAVLTIKDDTTIDGVILDVATNGVITVASGKKLTLALGAGTGKGSGGIFTADVGVVKANAATPVASGKFTNAAALAGAETQKAAAGTSGNLATGSADRNLADGKIGTAAAVTIDAEDTFAVTGTDTVGVTHS